MHVLVLLTSHIHEFDLIVNLENIYLIVVVLQVVLQDVVHRVVLQVRVGQNMDGSLKSLKKCQGIRLVRYLIYTLLPNCPVPS